MSSKYPIHKAFLRALPLELAEILDQTYFLHLLATDPAKVVPPGKSLLSMMTKPEISSKLDAKHDPKLSAIHDKVEDMVHKAFWDEALVSLSNPLPSSQLPRLRLFYDDLLNVLTPLLPPSHPILETLADPLPPTSSPLHSCLALLKDILISLKERCAPIRDTEIDELISKVDDPPPFIPASTPELSHPVSALAQLVVSTIKSILNLAETIKSDLRNFVFGSMTEAQLRAVIVQQAKSRERDIVLDIWGTSHEDGKDRLKQEWQEWIGELQMMSPAPDGKREKYILRVVQALGSTFPVSCDMPSTILTQPEIDGSKAPNALPGQFFFTTLSLLYAQNFLQGLTITACLRSLTRLPSDSTDPNTFTLRIWTLLKSEIDDSDEIANLGHTKIVNLADEVVRARKSTSAATSEEEETQLRAAVERTLRTTDPVFVLLQKRLMGALGKRLVELSRVKPAVVPHKMQTGRGKLELDPEEVPVQDVGTLIVKGFEDPVLVAGVREAVQMIRGCINWVEGIWGDMILTD